MNFYDMYVKTLWTDFKGWTVKEMIWLWVATITTLAISVKTSTAIETVCAVTGIMGAIFIAKGKISGYFTGIISTVLYVYVSYSYGLYGETIVYAILFVPMQFIGYYIWAKNSTVNKDTIEVIKKKLSVKNRIKVIFGTLAVICVYAIFIKFIEGKKPGLDSATSILSILATILMMYRYAEQWVVWIVVNVVAVIMWFIVMRESGYQGAASLVMWVMFLINSIYGYYSWFKESKEYK